MEFESQQKKTTNSVYKYLERDHCWCEIQVVMESQRLPKNQNFHMELTGRPSNTPAAYGSRAAE